MRKFACLFLSAVAQIALHTATAAAPAAEPPAKRVAILLFDGAEIIDYSGPWEVFGAAGYDVFTVARSKTPVTTAMGQTVIPKYDFSDVPDADIVLVPGGDVSKVRRNAETLSWLRKETARDQHTISVCNGAVTLAEAGLLDGLSATATYHWIPKMRTQFPKVHMVDDQRWVDNGKIITAAGLSAGIDGALHLVDVMDGRGEAEAVALGIEYNWQPEGGFVRAALADAQIPQIDLDSVGNWHIVETSGDRNQWALHVEGSSARGADELANYMSRGLEKQGHWSLASSGQGRGLTRWRFADRSGKPWRATLNIAPEKNMPGHYTMDITVERADA
jgi:putative intracellular protease/amidase